MKQWTGAALVAAALMFTGPAATGPAVAAPEAKVQSGGTSSTTGIDSRRHHRRYVRHTAYRPVHQPYYYGRPTYYRPYTYQVPAPFIFGIGFGPSWW